jgi:pimeloyl-ACP methyl ester carboxylesterase
MKGLLRTVMLLLGTVAAMIVAWSGWLYATQRSQIYFPTPETESAIAQVLWIDSAGERLKVWAVERPGPRALLYFGGNADEVAGHIETFVAAFPEHSLYLVNYRGYGGSSGRPSEIGLAKDALAVFDHVKLRHADVSVMGRSLGSGVAVQLAAARPVSQLVLVTPFDSLVNVAKEHFGWLPVGLLMRDRYESASRAREVKAPVLIVIAGEDEIIPERRSRALAAAFAPGQVQVVVVPGVGHNTLDLSPEYLQAVVAFLSELPAATGAPEGGKR